jgi:galactokinase/mevalonate kinase-like predicted kinase
MEKNPEFFEIFKELSSEDINELYLLIENNVEAKKLLSFIISNNI